MALSDLFAINFPYGMRKNEAGEWFVFNRGYLPLGTILPSEKEIYIKYKGLTEAVLEKLANPGSPIKRDDNGKIKELFLYKDLRHGSAKIDWDSYFERVKKLNAIIPY